MRQLFTIALKDLKLMSRDKMGMFFIVAFPIIMGVFFGSITNISSSSGPRLTLAVDNQDGSEIANTFLDNLAATENVKVIELAREEAIDRVRKGRLTGVIVIPPGFGDSAGVLWQEAPEIELGIDPARTAEAGMIEGMVMQAVGQLVSTRFQDIGGMRDLIDDSAQTIEQADDLGLTQRLALRTVMGSLGTLMDALEGAQRAEAENESEQQAASQMGFGGGQLAHIRSLDVTRELDPNSPRALAKKVRSKWDISFPSAMLWGMLGCVAGFAVLTVREKTLGTMVRLQVAPMPRWCILAGKGLACFIAVMFVLVVMTLVAYGLGMRPKRWDLYLLAGACSSLCFVGLMLLVSVIGKTEAAVGGASWGLNIVMAMFGGCMVPLAFMPGFMKMLSNFSPVKWAILALEGAVWRDFSFNEMLLPCCVLLGIGIFGTTVGSWLLTRRLNQA